MGLQYKGAWCTPPRIFMDHQPGRLPSTVDPDAVPSDLGKKVPQHPVRISAWKLAKLDSNEAIKAATKARASSFVLRPISSRHHPHDADHLSSSNVSGRSCPISTDQGFHNRYPRARTMRLSLPKSSYPPSCTSKEDIETCHHSVNNLGSLQFSNLTPSPLEQQIAHRNHFIPMYQSSADQSPWSSKRSEQNKNTVRENVAQIPSRNNYLGIAENTRSSVFWDQEAGRFVSSSSRGFGTELLYTGQSIFFSGPVVNGQPAQETRDGSSVAAGMDRGSTSSYYQQGRS